MLFYCLEYKNKHKYTLKFRLNLWRVHQIKNLSILYRFLWGQFLSHLCFYSFCVDVFFFVGETHGKTKIPMFLIFFGKLLSEFVLGT